MRTCHADEAKAFPASVHAARQSAALRATAACTNHPAEKLMPESASSATPMSQGLESSIHGQAARGDRTLPNDVLHAPSTPVKDEGDSTAATPARTWPIPAPSATATPASCHGNQIRWRTRRIPISRAFTRVPSRRQGRGNAPVAMAVMTSIPRPIRAPRSIIGTCRPPAANATRKSLASSARASTAKPSKNGARDAPVCIDCHGEHLITDPKSARALP